MTHTERTAQDLKNPMRFLESWWNLGPEKCPNILLHHPSAFFRHSRRAQNFWNWSKIVPPIYINRIMIFFSKKKFVAICVPNEKSFWTAVFAIYSTFYPFWTWAGSFFSNPFHFPAKWRHREMVGSFLLRFCEKIEEKLENLTFRRPESHLTIPNCLPASK